jgi:hypothetical protein
MKTTTMTRRLAVEELEARIAPDPVGTPGTAEGMGNGLGTEVKSGAKPQPSGK